MAAESYVVIGHVVKPHGLSGEVSVLVTTYALDEFVGVRTWFVPPGTVRSSRITRVRQGPKGPLVTFEDVSTATEAELIRGKELLVSSREIPDGAASAEQAAEITGFTVFDCRHGSIGTVVDTIITGANDVWVVHGAFGEVLIPVIEEVVLCVDEEARVIHVDLLDGLLPEKDHR